MVAKKLDILLIRNFIGPFCVTFFVTLFVLDMQFFWLYMDELIGKGLGLFMILHLLLLMSSTLVPLALPLGILLASIMTFGNMGEHFELVALKSSGISLNRFMRPLLIFIVFISGLAFIFNNNIIPVFRLKAYSLLYDLRNSKPTFNIRTGQFNNEIRGYSIRIGAKDPDGQTIHDIIIYDASEAFADTRVILAREGSMIPVAGKPVLIFRLRDGWRYQEGGGMNANAQNTQTRMHFDQYDKVFDLSAFRVSRTNEDLFKNAYQMMDVGQLRYTMDSMDQKILPRMRADNLNSASNYYSLLDTGVRGREIRGKVEALPAAAGRNYDSNFLQHTAAESRPQLTEFAASNLRSLKEMASNAALNAKLTTDNRLKFDVEFHKKFTLSFACLLLFLIGAPLGAIIRKGGLGMPMIIAIIFFLIWYIISMVGEKLSATGAAPPAVGMWLSTAMLLPIALFMIRQARNDAQLFNKEFYHKLWQHFRRLITRRR